MSKEWILFHRCKDTGKYEGRALEPPPPRELTWQEKEIVRLTARIAFLEKELADAKLKIDWLQRDD